MIKTRALPDSADKSTGAGGAGVICPKFIGGAGSLQRFGPGAAGALPSVSGPGEFHVLPGAVSPFPTGERGNSPGVSWMLTRSFESIPAGLPPVPVGRALDCRTSYELILRITHL